MDDYLIDHETLGKFVNELFKKKPLPANSAEELNNLREETIKSLDDKIGIAIFSRLTPAQNTEYNQLLDSDDDSPEAYQDFFNRAGINLQKIITDTAQEFSAEFLGGQNAQ